jgi:uncharacterized membrane protein
MQQLLSSMHVKIAQTGSVCCCAQVPFYFVTIVSCSACLVSIVLLLWYARFKGLLVRGSFPHVQSLDPSCASTALPHFITLC